MGKLAPSTRSLYERNMRQLVMPAFENYTLREIDVRMVDQFTKKLTAAKSYSTAKQARTVLSLALGLAVRYGALKKNPVRGIARMHKPPSETMALTLDQVEAIRAAVRSWRRAPGTPGPPPDGQLEQIIEVMLGTSARIGEPRQRRRCGVEALGGVTTPDMPATVIAERVGWTGSITWFREHVRQLRPEHRPVDPSDRLTWLAGDAAQCDLWFPPKKILLEGGTRTLLPVMVITAAHSRFMVAKMIPTRHTR